MLQYSLQHTQEVLLADQLSQGAQLLGFVGRLGLWEVLQAGQFLGLLLEGVLEFGVDLDRRYDVRV